MRLVHVIIPNWAKHNPRPDRANYTWFRFQNDFFQDPKVFGLSDGDIILFQMIICEASKRNRPEVTVNLDLMAALRKTTLKKLTKSLENLRQRELISTADIVHQLPADSRHSAGKLPANSPATNERTNETNERREGVESGDSTLPRLCVLWNNHCGPKLARVVKTNSVRNRKIELRYPDHSELEWVEIIERIAKSKFCCGENERGWRATFDWLLQPETALKVLEGKYDTRAGRSNGFDWEKYDADRKCAAEPGTP